MIFFVYGTLKKGYSNHLYLNRPSVLPLGEFTTEPKYTMADLGPCPVVYCKGTTAIQGELYETEDPNVISGIFRLEGYRGEGQNNFYELEWIETPLGLAAMFVMDVEFPSLIIKSGIWNKQ